MDDWLKPAFSDLYNHDGLVVMAPGLGCMRLLSKFIALYSNSAGENNKLVFCLNMLGDEAEVFNIMSSEGYYPHQHPKVITNEVPAQERQDMYLAGGCFIVTSRIAIVDLLTEKVNIPSITGFLVCNSHTITSTSMESFILRVFRQKNRTGFIKAFSDNPDSFGGGMGKVSSALQHLFVSHLYLWPRFQFQVTQHLDKRPTDVIELSQPLTPGMKAIQTALLSAIDSCIQELKMAVPHLDTGDFTLENGMFRSFDHIIRQQLDPEWHKISPRTKQLVSDVQTLRRLLDYLLSYDSVSFQIFLLTLRSASAVQKNPSLWLTSAAADLIFTRSRARIDVVAPLSNEELEAVLRVDTASDSRNSYSIAQLRHSLSLRHKLDPVLEVPPKWTLLEEVVTEISREYQRIVSETKGSTRTSTKSRSFNGRVLVLVRDERGAAQLKDVLAVGSKQVMEYRYRYYVSQQAALIRRRTGSSNSAVTSSGKGSDGSRARVKKLGPQDSAETLEEKERYGVGLTLSQLQGLPMDQQILLIQERELKYRKVHSDSSDSSNFRSNFINVDSDCEDNGEGSGSVVPQKRSTPTKSSLTTATSDKNKRQKATVDKRSFAPKPNEGTLSAAIREFQQEQWAAAEVRDAAASYKTWTGDDQSVEEDGINVRVMDSSANLIVMTHEYAKSKPTFLEDLMPNYIVMYDVDIQLIREIEVYTANSQTSPKVYFLIYEGSAEEHRYVTALSREKKAFESLIEVKANLVVSALDVETVAELEEHDRNTRIGSLSDTRTKKQAKDVKPGVILVDLREFRSILPSLLHRGGLQLIPLTLNIGDFVLAKEIVVERKGISDLFQSFASGRLYNQVEMMSKSYKFPCLLIEFAEDKAFSLQAITDITQEIQINNIISKLSLLLLSFSTLRILWSRSAHMTVDIFRNLKHNFEEPDLEYILSIDDNNQDSSRGDDSDDGVSRDMLLSLPGINNQNIGFVLSAVDSIADLCKLSKSQLDSLIGPANSKKLMSFFSHKI